MRVIKKNLLHKLLRPLLNWFGSIRGYGGCLICGDKWSWKKEHNIKMTEEQSAFPYCEECHLTANKHQKEAAVDVLARTWMLQAPPRFLKDTMKDSKLLKAAVREEIAFNRG